MPDGDSQTTPKTAEAHNLAEGIGHHSFMPSDMQVLVANAIKQQNAIKENFIARYLAATGARIEDTVLIEEHSDDGLRIRYWCEPKSVSDARPTAPGFADE
jgi:hypothetical protein